MNEHAQRRAEVISIADQRAAREAREAPPADEPSAAVPARARCGQVTAEGRTCRNYAVQDGHCRLHAAQAVPDTDPTDTAPPPTEPATAPPTTDRPSAPQVRRSDPDGDAARAHVDREAARRGWAPVVDALEALRDVAGERWIDHAREAAAFLRRRATGDYDVDEFGFDEDLTTHVVMPLVRPLHRHYWRVSSHGVDHVPTEGGALVVANHAGTLPADAVITRLDLFDRTGRHARELGADLVFRTPFVGEFSRKTGATLASGDDADRLLASGQLVAVWPEGFKGLGKPWRDRYKLQRFGRGGFVATALRSQVPIVPTAIVGSEEIYPMIYDLRVLARMLGFPYFPIVPQMFALPVLGPFALLPLPSKWLIEYGEPIETTEYGPQAADDPMAVFDLTDRVRDTIQTMLHRNLMGRRSVFL